MCGLFDQPVGGNKPELVAKLKGKVSRKMAEMLMEHLHAHLSVRPSLRASTSPAAPAASAHRLPAPPHRPLRTLTACPAAPQMAQLRELATPLGLKAKDAFTLQVGLAKAGVAPMNIMYASKAVSPQGTKPKKEHLADIHGVAPKSLCFSTAGPSASAPAVPPRAKMVTEDELTVRRAPPRTRTSQLPSRRVSARRRPTSCARRARPSA